MPRRAVWVFDFISPYAYLQFNRLHALPEGLELEFRPVLFAGLLSHWGQLGPAEIPQKKVHTMLTAQWRARRAGLPFVPPPRHPFNPLTLLRLSIALGNRRAVIATIFDHVWGRGEDGQAPGSMARLAARLELPMPRLERMIAAPEVKRSLRANTETAAREGVFGVPSIVIDTRIFWGDDMFGLLLDWLRDPGILETPEARRIAALPAAAERSRTAPHPPGEPLSESSATSGR
ncbi:2-hydroxychromene-2-carboxylate isomerase [Profundibacterium mesophilum]|uniref:2-hydroxychromene-2-carboxylate isomerase n=1 Tax=Profundibacterium mesophilum KAUST100406-0324 TaxID=1037889 RepID=A0A921NWT1_9RHOB|nr:2-hydroxychromene-2-carboxylate isomerase [Profundibacterium mesophilum]KAF0677118.1 2-hydroxychromene-2-carboxylate isomerase [Profundibacterium mesophilum KAUST100406-0324]